MSPRNPADMTVPDLIDEFRQLADQLGNPFQFGVRPERYRGTPERAARVARMNALTPEMRLRAPADALKTMMEDSDNDIRVWAAMRFGAIDPVLSNSATTGVCERMSTRTRQAQRLIEHARTPPPSRPTLAEMSLDELVARFSDACLREYWTRYCGEGTQPLDVELCNKIDGEVRQIVAELRRRGACDRLLPLLDSPSITERAEAARATFEVAPERALKHWKRWPPAKIRANSDEPISRSSISESRRRGNLEGRRALGWRGREGIMVTLASFSGSTR